MDLDLSGHTSQVHDFDNKQDVFEGIGCDPAEVLYSYRNNASLQAFPVTQQYLKVKDDVN